MTSLSEVYEPDAEFQVGEGRLYLGAGLFVLGTLLVIAGIVAATTDLLVPESGTLVYAREWGGILAGLGVPLFFLGVFTVLPSSRRTRAAAVIGASVAFLGVALFWHAYPCQWSGSNCGEGLMNLTLPTTLTYFSGTVTTFWCLFVGVANFKARNSPGGTATLEVQTKGETKVVEVERSGLDGVGGVGVFGHSLEPEGPSPTNGDDAATVSDGGAQSTGVTEAGDGAVVERTTQPDGPTGQEGRTRSNTGGTTTDDAGTGGAPLTDDDWTPSGDAGRTDQPGGADRDRYCGSCRHFRYVRTERGMQPYCGAHREVMEDMEACDRWESR